MSHCIQFSLFGLIFIDVSMFVQMPALYRLDKAVIRTPQMCYLWLINVTAAVIKMM